VSVFSNKTVVITGASAGVGRAIALRFGAAGARIGLIARDAEALNEVKVEIERSGGSALVVPADVADAEAIAAAADDIERQLGAIEIWINDAMVTIFSPVWNITPAEYRRVTEVTYLGVVHGTMAALRHMRKRARGTIIQIGSALAYRGIPLQAAYCGAKYAIRGFTDSLRTELLHGHSAINLMMIELPAVNTPQFDWARTHMGRQPRPVPPIVEPEVIAQAVFLAALHPGREYWIGFPTIKAILANMIAPGLLDRYLARSTISAQQTPVAAASDRKDNLISPVRGLHRTRGSFGSEASLSAVTLAGPTARLIPVLLGGIVVSGLAVLALRSKG
jgi:NADP-dependent 3-hydroxy acid dehydrogenase YdfG